MTRVLLIGAGSIASRHLAALRKIDTVRIAGVCDSNLDRARALAQRAEAPAYSGAAEAIDALHPDYVAILTPRQVRTPLIELCLARKLPFLVEKPPCDRLSVGLQLREQIAAAGILHSVGFMHRWHDALNAVLSQLRGEHLTLINIRFLAPFGTAPVIDRYPDPYLVERSGGLVGDQGIHYIDLARYISQAEVGTVSATGANQRLPRSAQVSSCDVVCWTLRMSNDVIVNHSHTWGAAGWDSRVNLVTDQSDMTIDMFGNQATGTRAGKPCQITGTVDEFELQHRGLLTALATNNATGIRSPYADALRSFHAAARVNLLLYGQTGELDVPWSEWQQQ